MPEDIYGIVYSSMILVEVIMMFISLKIKKINNKLILIIASFTPSVKQFMHLMQLKLKLLLQM